MNQTPTLRQKTTLIWNPTSGSGTQDIQAMISGDWATTRDFVVQETKDCGDATRYSSEACRDEKATVLVAGGDGTIGEVVHGLATGFANVRLGILPTGTGNDFARWLGIPLDLKAAIETVMTERTRRVDVIRASSHGEVLRYFVNVSVSVTDQEGQERIEAGFKNNWGLLGYLQAGFEAVNEIEAHDIELKIDEEKISLEGSVVVVGSGGSMSAGIHVLPDAKVDDGKLDVAVFRPTTVAGLALLAPWVLSGNHMGGDQVFHRTAKRLTISGKPPLSFTIDDHVFTRDEFTFEVLPQALEIIVGEQESEKG